MGVFRDFFTRLYDEHIKQPIDGIKERIPTAEDIKTAITAPIDGVKEWIADKITEGLLNSMEKLEPDTVEMIEKAIDETLEIKELPEGFKKILEETKSKRKEAGLIGALLFLGGMGIGYAMNILGPIFTPGRHYVNKILTPSILPIDQLILLHYRKEIGDDVFYDQMAKWGFDKEQTDRLRKAYLYYPSPTDFIRFAVRDIFRPEVVKKYGYEEGWGEIEKEMKEYVEKAGMSMDILKWYYLSHWELPSPTMAYEMLHRGLIEEEDIRTLLKIADVAPWWIDKLIGISYSPITRVDLRRLYQAGVIDEERLFRGYKELGYNDENARAITEWVIKGVEEEDRDLTKTEILRNYRIGKVTREKVKEMLVGIGYSEDEAEWILAYEDYKIGMEELESEAEAIVVEAREGHITYEEADKKLEDLGLPIKTKEKYLGRIKREIRQRIEHPSKEDLKRWLKMGIISEEEFKTEMRARRWQEKDIDRFVKEVKGG